MFPFLAEYLLFLLTVPWFINLYSSSSDESAWDWSGVALGGFNSVWPSFFGIKTEIEWQIPNGQLGRFLLKANLKSSRATIEALHGMPALHLMNANMVWTRASKQETHSQGTVLTLDILCDTLSMRYPLQDIHSCFLMSCVWAVSYTPKQPHCLKKVMLLSSGSTWSGSTQAKDVSQDEEILFWIDERIRKLCYS